MNACFSSSGGELVTSNMLSGQHWKGVRITQTGLDATELSVKIMLKLGNAIYSHTKICMIIAEFKHHEIHLILLI